MKIRSKLLAIAVMPVTVLLVAGTILFLISVETDRAHVKRDMTDAFSDMNSNLIVLAYEYALSREERPKTQWTIQHEALRAHIKEMLKIFTKREEIELINEAYLNCENAGRLFGELIEYDRGDLSDNRTPVFFQTKRTIDRLIIELQAIMPPANSLSKMIDADQVRYARIETVMIISLTVSLTAVIWPLIFLVIRGISGSLMRFEKGMKITVFRI